MQVAAARDVGRRGDPVVELRFGGGSGAPNRVARSVQRVIPATVPEPVEAVRPPGGHVRVGASEGGDTDIRLAELRGAHQCVHGQKTRFNGEPVTT